LEIEVDLDGIAELIRLLETGLKEGRTELQATPGGDGDTKCISRLVLAVCATGPHARLEGSGRSLELAGTKEMWQSVLSRLARCVDERCFYPAELGDFRLAGRRRELSVYLELVLSED